MLYKELLVAFQPTWTTLLTSGSFTVVGRIQQKQYFSKSDFLCCFRVVMPNNFLFGCFKCAGDIQRVLKQSKKKRLEIQNIVGNDGITYPSVISQPIPHGFTWDGSDEDMEYAHIYLSNFKFAYDIETEFIVLVFVGHCVAWHIQVLPFFCLTSIVKLLTNPKKNWPIFTSL